MRSEGVSRVRRSRGAAFLAILVCLGASERINAATAVLRPVADTSLHEQVPTNNVGGGSTILAGTTAQGRRTRALIRFDVSAALPAQAVIRSARLDLTMVADASGGAGILGIRIHRMLVPWTEGTKTGNQGEPAEGGETCWNWRVFPTVAWSRPGTTPGIEYEASASASTIVGGLGEWSWKGNLVEDVRLWATNTAANLGWLLISDPDGVARTARRFASREDPDQPPALVVDYDLPSGELRLPMPLFRDGQFHIVLPLAAGKSHILETRGELAGGSWQTLASFPAEPAVRELPFEIPITGAARFLRLRQE